MTDVITKNLDLWTSALLTKSTAGRGSNGKQEAYGIKKLRELILELAVRGKLVPQDPNDEPVSVLLEKIADEKRRLVKESKIKKPKELPEITEDEKPFELSKGWEYVRLNDLGEWGAGATPLRSRHDYYGGDIPWFKSGELVADYISESEEHVTKLALKETSLRYNQPGDVLIAMYGATIGKTSILKVTATTNQAVCACTPFTGFANIFLLTLLKAYKSRFVDQGAGGAQPNISREKIIATVIALPPTAEQHRIVAKVDELMALCDELEQQQTHSLEAHKTLVETLLGTLTRTATHRELNEAWTRIANHFDTLFTTEHSIDQLKNTILQLAIMGKLVPQDPNDEPAGALLNKISEEKARLFNERIMGKEKAIPPISDEFIPREVPVGWEVVRFGSLINLVSGHHLKPDEYSIEDLGEMLPYLTGPAEFGVMFPEPTRYTNERRAMAEPGDVLITCKGSGVGKTNVANTLVAISRQLMSIRPIVITTEFTKLLVDSLKDPIREKIVGIAIPGISREDVLEAVVHLPPLREQDRIVAKFDKLIALCDALKGRFAETQTTQIYLADVIIEQAVA